MMGLAVGVVYDSVEERFFDYFEENVDQLIERLLAMDVVVGFNVKRFDYAVLSGYTDLDFSRIETIDMLEDIHARLGFRLSLDHLAGANLGAEKSGDGLLAVEWWRSGDKGKVVEYCRKDVEITRELFLLGARQGYLLFRNREGARLRVPVDWSV